MQTLTPNAYPNVQENSPPQRASHPLLLARNAILCFTSTDESADDHSE